MSSFSAPAQLITYSSPASSLLTVVVHSRNLRDCGLSCDEYWTDTLACFLASVLMTLTEFLKRSLSTTTNVNAPFLAMSVLTSSTELLMASMGSETKTKQSFFN